MKTVDITGNKGKKQRKSKSENTEISQRYFKGGQSQWKNEKNTKKCAVTVNFK